ncbi:hypothetical protein ISN44_As03g039590 [Arabidopsis suecica]|uniref:Uncharacterized protein n=1 Tax=Arabidopsis suecica TaxID=45249 RepID=A0A8T2FFF6_ARASU|nr:hypothetical protein ISN44_As03g039590 [Arabidopsis suecica]
MAEPVQRTTRFSLVQLIGGMDRRRHTIDDEIVISQRTHDQGGSRTRPVNS